MEKETFDITLPTLVDLGFTAEESEHLYNYILIRVRENHEKQV